jgi:hypothetical protein
MILNDMLQGAKNLNTASDIRRYLTENGNQLISRMIDQRIQKNGGGCRKCTLVRPYPVQMMMPFACSGEVCNALKRAQAPLKLANIRQPQISSLAPVTTPGGPSAIYSAPIEGFSSGSSQPYRTKVASSTCSSCTGGAQTQCGMGDDGNSRCRGGSGIGGTPRPPVFPYQESFVSGGIPGMAPIYNNRDHSSNHRNRILI